MTYKNDKKTLEALEAYHFSQRTLLFNYISQNQTKLPSELIDLTRKYAEAHNASNSFAKEMLNKISNDPEYGMKK